MSQKSPPVVTGIIEWIRGFYGDHRISHGKKHEYLGMDIDYSTIGKITFSINKYTHNVIDKLPKDLSKIAKTPAGEYHFTV